MTEIPANIKKRLNPQIRDAVIRILVSWDLVTSNIVTGSKIVTINSHPINWIQNDLNWTSYKTDWISADNKKWPNSQIRDSVIGTSVS